MSEEQKMEVKPIGKPPLSYEARLETLSWKNLEGECRKLSKKPKMEGALADALLIVFFKTHNKGNDPFMLDSNSLGKKTYDAYRTKIQERR